MRCSRSAHWPVIFLSARVQGFSGNSRWKISSWARFGFPRGGKKVFLLAMAKRSPSTRTNRLFHRDLKEFGLTEDEVECILRIRPEKAPFANVQVSKEGEISAKHYAAIHYSLRFRSHCELACPQPGCRPLRSATGTPQAGKTGLVESGCLRSGGYQLSDLAAYTRAFQGGARDSPSDQAKRALIWRLIPPSLAPALFACPKIRQFVNVLV
jgi:hypothetical protein